MPKGTCIFGSLFYQDGAPLSHWHTDKAGTLPVCSHPLASFLSRRPRGRPGQLVGAGLVLEFRASLGSGRNSHRRGAFTPRGWEASI